MEKPRVNIGNLTGKILIIELDLNKVFAGRQKIISKMDTRTHTPEDIRVYIILCKRIISDVETKRQTIERINEYYEENEPENIRRQYWLDELEVSLLELEAHQSDLEDFLNNGRTEKTNDLFHQYHAARKRADDATFTIAAPGQSYKTLILGKFTKPNGTELSLPNCGINSFDGLQQYCEKFERDLLPLIQRSHKETADIKSRILMSTYEANAKILEILYRVVEINEVKTKKVEEISQQLKKIQPRTKLPSTIDKQLETDLVDLDKLHAELERIMLNENQALSELKTLTA